VASHRSFFAAGFAGQLIQVIPDLDLVVVLTSDIDQERYDAENLVGETIVPAIAD
jgi:CubicO group peptidase (beta-lactamase class C family)